MLDFALDHCSLLPLPGIINMKNSIAVDRGPTLLVTPAASSSLSNLAAVPVTLVKGNHALSLSLFETIGLIHSSVS